MCNLPTDEEIQALVYTCLYAFLNECISSGVSKQDAEEHIIEVCQNIIDNKNKNIHDFIKTHKNNDLTTYPGLEKGLKKLGLW